MSNAPATPTFGVQFVGKEFTWNTVVDDEITPVTFRARSGITFDEVLEFRAIQAELQMSSQLLARTLDRRADAIDGEEAAQRPIDEIRAELEDLSRQATEHERERWERILDQTVILVHPPHRERLRSMLAESSFQAVTELRDWLYGEVMGRPERQAEEVGGVDPTLPPPPPDSPSNDHGGPDSGPEASASTD